MIGAAFAGAGTVVLKIVVLKIKDDGVLTWLQRPAKEVLADDAALPAESLQIQEVVKEVPDRHTQICFSKESARIAILRERRRNDFICGENWLWGFDEAFHAACSSWA